MAGEGILDEIAPGELTNIGNVEPRWMDVAFDPGRKHSIPYQWGSTRFSVNRDVYTDDIRTTATIFDPPEALRGKINVLDSQREVMLMAALSWTSCWSRRTSRRWPTTRTPPRGSRG